ncbi:MAG: hypothetical protein V3T02_05060 [Alphaproteobacteria bacterium]
MRVIALLALGSLAIAMTATAAADELVKLETRPGIEQPFFGIEYKVVADIAAWIKAQAVKQGPQSRR